MIRPEALKAAARAFCLLPAPRESCTAAPSCRFFLSLARISQREAGCIRRRLHTRKRVNVILRGVARRAGKDEAVLFYPSSSSFFENGTRAASCFAMM